MCVCTYQVSAIPATSASLQVACSPINPENPCFNVAGIGQVFVRGCRRHLGGGCFISAGSGLCVGGGDGVFGGGSSSAGAEEKVMEESVASLIGGIPAPAAFDSPSQCGVIGHTVPSGGNGPI